MTGLLAVVAAANTQPVPAGAILVIALVVIVCERLIALFDDEGAADTEREAIRHEIDAQPRVSRRSVLRVIDRRKSDEWT